MPSDVALDGSSAAHGSTAATFERLARERHSCRSFLPDPLAPDVVEQLLAIAQRAPSWCNTQPQQVHLLEGEALQRFVRGLQAHVASGAEVASDLGVPEYEGVHLDRRREAGFGLYDALGIEKADVAGRQAQGARNLDFFGAPHAVIVTTPRALGTYGALDCGGYVTMLQLAAGAMGLGSVAQGAIAMYSDFVREWVGVPEDRWVVCAVAFGHEDRAHAVNGFRTSRAGAEHVVRPVG